MKIFRNFPSDAKTTPCVLAIGNFDGVHRGHMALLERAGKTAKHLHMASAVLTFSPHPRQYFAIKAGQPDKAPTTITSLRNKLQSFHNARMDRVFLLRFNDRIANLTPLSFIERVLVKGLNIKSLVVGEEFRFGSHRSGTTDDLVLAGKQYGFDVHVIPAVVDNGNRISSSAVRKALKNNDFIEVKKLLGSPYHISGHVFHGDKRGHDLGFPTANLPMRHFNPILSGVYITLVHGLAPKPLPAVSVIGTRPTVDETPRIVLETHILDYSRNCYGALIHVAFLKKLRDNRKFANLKALMNAISEDVETARIFFNNSENASLLEQNCQIDLISGREL